MQLTVGTNG